MRESRKQVPARKSDPKAWLKSLPPPARREAQSRSTVASDICAAGWLAASSVTRVAETIRV